MHPVLAWVEALYACVLDDCLGLEGSSAVECGYHGVNAC
jgi:hypothetical protein